MLCSEYKWTNSEFVDRGTSVPGKGSNSTYFPCTTVSSSLRHKFIKTYLSKNNFDMKLARYMLQVCVVCVAVRLSFEKDLKCMFKMSKQD